MLPMSKFISIEEAVSKVKDGMTIMVVDSSQTEPLTKSLMR